MMIHADPTSEVFLWLPKPAVAVEPFLRQAAGATGPLCLCTHGTCKEANTSVDRLCVIEMTCSTQYHEFSSQGATVQDLH